MSLLICFLIQWMYVGFNVYIWLVLHRLILFLHKIRESHKPAHIVQRKPAFHQKNDEEVASQLSFIYLNIF